MRLASGFFASLPAFKLSEHPEAFDLKTPRNWPWFYLRSKQLFLHFQDSIHLVTKWRNRLLSSHAQLRFGDQFISIEHLHAIIRNDDYSKLDHGLTTTDVNPKDRQNYGSCVRIASDDVLTLLVDNVDTYGTFLYLLMLKMIIKTYVDKSTKISERMLLPFRRNLIDSFGMPYSCYASFLGLESSWCLVFVCRLWWAWIQHKDFASTRATTTQRNNSKDRFFITKTAYFSVEMNAHNLLYIVLTIREQQLPIEALNVYLFNSQGCESMFRNARALSGTYSSIVNFTVADFLRRSQKISILNRIKCDQVYDEENVESLSFPVHHKHKKDAQSHATEDTNDIDRLDIEQIIKNAYDQALQLTERLGISKLLEENNVLDLDELSEFVFQRMNSSSKTYDNSQVSANQVDKDLDLEEDSDGSETNEDFSEEDEDGDCPADEEVNQENSIRSGKTNFTRMKIFNDIEAGKRDSYFEFNVNGTVKYLHKQSACWLLTDNRSHLSSDRLSRVIQTSRKDHTQRL